MTKHKVKLCECGCGKPTLPAKHTRRSCGHVKGQPLRFLNGHTHSRSLDERFWRKVNKHGPMPSAESIQVHPDIAGQRCWEWTGMYLKGYGRIDIKPGKSKPATHLMWYVATGEWPTLDMLHKCDNSKCVRFSHVFEGTHRENVKDMDRKGRRARLCGEDSPSTALTWSKVRLIRSMLSTGNNYKLVADTFSISISTLFRIKRGDVWKESDTP